MQIIKDVRFGTDYVDENNVLHVGGTGGVMVLNASQVSMVSDYYGPGTLAHTSGWKMAWHGKRTSMPDGRTLLGVKILAVNNDTLVAAIALFESKADAGVVSDRVTAIENEIPAEASSANKLADKAYVDNSINAQSAFFRGTFATNAALMVVQWQTSDPTADNYVANNDYAYVEADETHDDQVWRYAYKLEAGVQDNGWHAQYMISDGPFTQGQLAAINSGITSTKVDKITSISVQGNKLVIAMA